MKVQSQHPEWAGLWLKHTERRSRCCSSATFTLFDAVDAQATCTRALRWRFLEATHDGVFSWRLITVEVGLQALEGCTEESCRVQSRQDERGAAGCGGCLERSSTFGLRPLILCFQKILTRSWDHVR